MIVQTHILVGFNSQLFTTDRAKAVSLYLPLLPIAVDQVWEGVKK